MSAPESLDNIKRGHSDEPVVQILLQRWSPRAFSEKPVAAEDLRTIFTAAAWAASSFNEQPWRFVVGAKGDAVYEAIFDTLTERNRSWAGSAPVLFATFAKKSFTANGTANAVAMHDTGAASANLSLQAVALGLHTHGMAGFDREKLRAAFSVPEDFDPVACWALGYLGDPGILPSPYKEMELQARSRKTLDLFVFSAWNEPSRLVIA